MISESSRNAKSSQCFKRQGYDRVAAQYPSRNLLARETDDKIETLVYEPIDSATDSDDDFKISSIQLGVVRYSYTTVKMRTGVGLLCSTLI